MTLGGEGLAGGPGERAGKALRLMMSVDNQYIRHGRKLSSFGHQRNWERRETTSTTKLREALCYCAVFLSQ